MHRIFLYVLADPCEVEVLVVRLELLWTISMSLGRDKYKDDKKECERTVRGNGESMLRTDIDVNNEM